MGSCAHWPGFKFQQLEKNSFIRCGMKWVIYHVPATGSQLTSHNLTCKEVLLLIFYYHLIKGLHFPNTMGPAKNKMTPTKSCDLWTLTLEIKVNKI